MSSRLVRLLPGFVAVAVGSVAWVLGTEVGEPVPWHQLVLLVLAVAVTELLPIHPPRGRPVQTSVAVIATGALIGVDAPTLTLLTAFGWFLARAVDRRISDASSDLLVRSATAWVLAGLAAFGRGFGPPWHGADESLIQLDLVAAILVIFVLVAVLPALEVVAAGEVTRYPLRRIADEIRATWSADLAVAATAVLGALVHRSLGPWTLPSVLIPLLAARIGLDRFAGVATAYDQTIRAMSRLPEQLGTITADHGVRVGRLARAVAGELGMDAASTLDLERAAYLHELGHIRLEPEQEPTRLELARAGARVITSAGDLDRVAEIVEAHGDTTGLRTAPRAVAKAARIVAACCEAERYDPDVSDAGQRREVTVRLVRDVEDLDVVQAVLGSLDRGVLKPRPRG